MKIKNDEWKLIGQRKKEQIGHCEICGKELEPKELRARHLAYGEEIEDKYMIIVCPRCNHNIHLAEEEVYLKLSIVNDALQKSIKRLYEEYARQHNEIMSDAMIRAIGTHRTDKRAVISHLFRWNDLNKDIIIDCKRRGVLLNYKDFDNMTNKKLYKLKTEKKEQANNTQSEIHLPPEEDDSLKWMSDEQ